MSKNAFTFNNLSQSPRLYHSKFSLRATKFTEKTRAKTYFCNYVDPDESGLLKAKSPGFPLIPLIQII